MPVLESEIEKGVCDWADRRGISYIKLDPYTNKGWPDRIFFLWGGRPLLMELKRPGEKPRKLQQYVLRKLERMGYDVCVAETTEEGVAYLRDRILRNRDEADKETSRLPAKRR